MGLILIQPGLKQVIRKANIHEHGYGVHPEPLISFSKYFRLFAYLREYGEGQGKVCASTSKGLWFSGLGFGIKTDVCINPD
jgi:hypothetical protein